MRYSADHSYHYPPELVELLCDTIPLLARSKQGVIDFFAGAGVPAEMLAEWRKRLSRDREGVKKHEVVRAVIRKVNEAGEPGLVVRREVVKRVVQFEDFSACWEGDRLKAEGLVARVRHVVNVKDSFTRINQEREEERRKHRAVKEAELEAKRLRDARREALKSALYDLFAEGDPHARGKKLEAVLNDLFASAGLLVREGFARAAGGGVVEQIDGAVEVDGALYLVEMKWWKEPIGRGEIAPHLVGVYNRAAVGGIFISYSGYSQAAIDDAKAGLAQRVFVLTELSEIVQALDRGGDLGAMFREKIRRAKMDKDPFFKV